MEISTREKILQIVSRYVIITLSISIMTIGVYFFKFPNNFVFGGVTGGADAAVEALLTGALVFHPDVTCNHHGDHHGGTCGEHGCGGH